MVSREDLAKKYQGLSTNELMDILEDKFSYTELAVTVAFEEISKRNVTEDDVRKFKDEKVKEAANFISRNIVDELSFFQKNLFFFIWVPFLNFLVKRNFMDDGAILKLKQANYYSWMGFGFFMFFILIQSSREFSDLLFFACWILSFAMAYYYDEYFLRIKRIKKFERIFGVQIYETEKDGHNDSTDL